MCAFSITNNPIGFNFEVGQEDLLVATHFQESTEFEEEIISTETKFQRIGFGVAGFGNGFVKRTEKTERERKRFLKRSR
nr:hypothetical protein CFP56_40952 [Quercus suber]